MMKQARHYCLQFIKYKDSFLSAVVWQGVANGIPPKLMDEVSVEAMLNEVSVN